MLLARAGQAGHVVSSCRPSSGVASVSPRCGSSLAWGARRGAPEIIGGTRPLAPSQLCTRSQAAGAPGSRLQAFSQDATPSTSNRGADTAETTGHGDLQALIGAIPFRKLAIVGAADAGYTWHVLWREQLPCIGAGSTLSSGESDIGGARHCRAQAHGAMPLCQ